MGVWGLAVLGLLGGVGAGLNSCASNNLGDDGGAKDLPAFMGPYSDLPKDPVGAGNIQPGMVAGLASAFQGATNNASGGPCLTEPTLGALYPRNFTAPLFEWQGSGGQNIYELRLHIDNQINDLVVYTDAASYTLPDAMWGQLATNSQDHDVEITIRGGNLVGGQLMGGAYTGSTGKVRIAPVTAQGAIVYWTTSNGSALKGFRVGDKQVQTVLTPASITAAGRATTCVGCHVSSPDGALAFFGNADPRFAVDARQVNGSSGAPTTMQVTANALANLARTNQDLPTLSKGHYGSSDAVVVTVMNGPGTAGRWELIWTDLLATSGGTGIIARNGDTNNASVPSWSHNGDTIIYTSSNAVVDGRVDTGNGDLYTVPYNNRSGGTATALPGVNSTMYNQYYPVYSPGDGFIAFNRNPRGTNMYDSANAEIWVAPATGGMPTRLLANDPPTCGTATSPGITNSWARWSPTVSTAKGKHYYWLVFSSKRRGGTPARPQLFLSAIVTTDGAGGEVLESTYPAIYIPTQPANENNHTPAWDDFQIPIG